MSESHQVRAPLRVVGIGASAGGLSALERFFDRLPSETGMAFVVIQHLSPDFRSLMGELLARHTELPIQLVEDGMAVEADHVYLIPPRKEMIISGGRLLLSDRDTHNELTLPIDVFFRSLAQDCGEKAVAIVLSGGGSDGSRGVRAVAEAGGLVIVQDVETAQFDGMPKMAREAGVPHIVCPPQDMPGLLLDSTRRPLRASVPPSEARGLEAVYRVLEAQFGIDFTHYKPSTITRRIERRIALAHSPDIEEYVARLRQDRDELDVLYRDLLIDVTRFFRDEPAFELLEQQVLPELLMREPRDTPLRLWVAGCASGEEAYSLAIVLQDLMARLGERPVKIFATDVHRGSLERAARAVYEEEAVAHVSPERLERYFLQAGSTYQVVPDVRQMVVFASHNVMRDPPFTRVDLISCRNLLIYFQPAAQQKVLSLFHFALNRGGVLFLGPSESAGPLAYGFEIYDKTWQVHRKHSDVRVPVDTRLQAGGMGDGRGAMVAQPARYSLSELLGTYDTLLDEVMPPSLLVNDRGELVHVFGGASRLLKLRDGRQGLDVLDIVEPELRMVLVSGLKRALHERAALVFKGVRLPGDEGERLYNVTIRGIRAQRGHTPHVLVSLEPTSGSPRPSLPETEIELDLVSREQLLALEGELRSTKESLQASNEELQASNEELQAANEELQSSNEELQSTNEELQSVNEELYTVNAEYQRKIDALTELTNDMDNLLSSTEVGTIFLDSQLKIRKFTPQIAETVSLVPHDIGRPIEIFAHRMDHPGLMEDLKAVLATGQTKERELRGVAGRSFFLRLLPYRKKGAIDGVVLTLIDVSGLKAAEDALFHERYLLNSLLGSVHDAIAFKDTRGKFIRVNPAMAARLGLSDPQEAAGKTAFELPLSQDAAVQHLQDEHVLHTGRAEHDRLERRERPDGTEGWDLVTRLPLRDPTGRIVGLIVIFRDVTEQKRAEAKIQEAVRRRDQFLAMLSHELRNPLGAIVTATGLLRAEANKSQREPPKLLEILERQSRQMARLLDDLLEASRVTQNKIELRKRVLDMGAIVRETADAVRSQFDARGIHLSLMLDGPPLLVEGDPTRLGQVVANLLSNAAKYTPRGGRVVLETRRDGGEVVLSVRDDGAGISFEMLDSVFDLFVQAGRTLDRSAGGLGVGLTLVRSLVAMHGGSVTAHSEGEGKGSEFVVRLPLAPTRLVDEDTPTRRRSRLPAAAKVVVVEDNADSRELLCEVLANAGFECRSAETGNAGLSLIQEFRPDIALLDVGLPEMDGFQLAKLVRGDPETAQICLIALTGYGQPSDRAMGRESGFDAHLVKPVDPDELVRLLAELSRGEPGEVEGTEWR